MSEISSSTDSSEISLIMVVIAQVDMVHNARLSMYRKAVMIMSLGTILGSIPNTTLNTGYF